MTYPQNPIAHPELGPSNSVGSTSHINKLPTSGSITFSAPLPSDPETIIQRAITEGDTTEKRNEQFAASVAKKV